MKKKYSPSLFKKLGWRIESVSDWFRYRTHDRYHVVNTGLSPAYYDKDTLLLHANFSLLVDFVEEECAWMNFRFEKKRPFSHKLPAIIRNLFVNTRSREAGLEFIDWHITHEYTDEDKRNMGFDTEESYEKYRESYAAPWKEIRELYIWWKDVRPLRKDPIEESGFSQLCDELREKYGCWLDNMEEVVHNGQTFYKKRDVETPEERELSSKLAMLSHEIEKEQDQEDEDMLIRLIKVRKCLWT